MLAQLGARLRSLVNGHQYWEQEPVREVGAIQLMHRLRDRWEVLHNTSPAPRRFDIRAVLATGDRARAGHAAPAPLADADWNVALPTQWVDAAGNVTRLDDAFFAQREYRLESLTGFSDAVFVSLAYRCVLKRTPDRTGVHNFLSRMRTGEFDRIDVLRSLTRSSEAQPVGVRITRLGVIDFWRRAQRLPVVGRLLVWTNAFVRLPRLTRRQQVLEAQAAAWRRENQDEARQIIQSTTGPILASLAALELARGQIEDGLTAVAHVLERLDAESRRRIDDGEAQALRIDDRLDRLSTATQLVHDRIEWLDKRLPPSSEGSTERSAALPEPLDDASIARICAEVEARLSGDPVDTGVRVERRSAWIREAGPETHGLPVLDLGCGRGDWLAALRDQGFEARGVEASRALVDACRRRGLVAEHGDPASWLPTAPAGSFGVVSALHQMEGVPLSGLIELLRGIRRVLVADGLLIIEATDPGGTSSTIGSHDARPVRPAGPVPLTPAVLEYLVASQGFERVRVVHDPVDPSVAAGGDAIVYAIVARTGRQDSSQNARSS